MSDGLRVQGCKGAKPCKKGALHPRGEAETKGAMHCIPIGMTVLLHPYVSLGHLTPDADAVLAELRTPLHGARTPDQLMQATGLTRTRVERAVRSLSVTHAVRRANFADGRLAWLLPS